MTPHDRRQSADFSFEIRIKREGPKGTNKEHVGKSYLDMARYHLHSDTCGGFL